MTLRLRFTGELWEHDGDGGWRFITLPGDAADEIRETCEARGFGSVRVTATIGGSTWSTSVFPETKSGSFVLPVKKPVRRSEQLEDGDQVDVQLLIE
jgi:hypothetical protein